MVDVQAFEAQAARSDPASLQAAVDLYRGDFLNNFYDDWVFSERYRLESLLLRCWRGRLPPKKPSAIPAERWPRPGSYSIGTHCARMRTGRRCEPSAASASATQP